uniref:TSA: Wollemia nobilis Ref_Wollemi_Transcript_9693_1409 transcribed RNA sequence n=1 Tax=Wollemia nobilis TaxID=56998 RepID=A0A0C9RW49_9CONI
MGNTNVREGGEKIGEDAGGSHPEAHLGGGGHGQREPGRISHGGSSESMGHSPPESPGRSTSPVLFASQVPVAPLPNSADSVTNQPWAYNSSGSEDIYYERGIPTMITWSYGGNDVVVEGSWDNWTSRQPLHRAGKDFTIMLVLPSGIYQYKFIVDGEWRYVPDLPWITDEMGNANNVLDVHDYVPENLESVAEFEPPQSPDSSYSGSFPAPEDFAKEPPVVPPHLHLTLLNVPPVETPEVVARPQHVILNHLYVEKGRSSQSVLALGLTHRFRSKYVTVILYKPLKVKE